ncbi:DUF2953 domain-containing protein [Methanobrevibacter sp.]|uniref:DUF2953 domain-containing protein n=1 Tax=Methanobrevibacter sp. TaxID=66852 RepID=UPI003890F191
MIIIIFIIILLFIGVKITLIYNKKGSEFKGCLKILILKKIKVYSLDFPSKDSQDEDKSEDSDDESERDIKKIFNLAKPCFEYFKEFIKSTANCIKIKKLQNHIIFGMDSYSDTGEYIGYIWAVLSVVNSVHKNARLSAEPSFNGSVLDGHGHNELDINILKIMPSAIRLISKKEIRELIKGVRNG